LFLRGKKIKNEAVAKLMQSESESEDGALFLVQTRNIRRKVAKR
jgi:hypothetical protein